MSNDEPPSRHDPWWQFGSPLRTLLVGLWRSSKRWVVSNVKLPPPHYWRSWFGHRPWTLFLSIAILLMSIVILATALNKPSYHWPPTVAGVVLAALAAAIAYIWLLDRSVPSQRWTRALWAAARIAVIATVGLVTVERIWRGVPAPDITDFWTYGVPVVTALFVLLLLVLLPWLALSRSRRTERGSITRLIPHLIYKETSVVVFLKAGKSEPYDQVSLWTIDAQGNLTLWTEDFAKATFPEGTWDRVERTTPRQAHKVRKAHSLEQNK